MGLISSLWQFREVLWLSLFIRQETEHVQVIKIFTWVTRLVRDGVWPQSLYLGLHTKGRHEGFVFFLHSERGSNLLLSDMLPLVS